MLKRYPLLWLDKVCINQNDTSQAISVLPIIIGGCKQVLVLLSSSYLKRLWCVWELFTLFSFCNKELALERVTVIHCPSKGEDLTQVVETFHLDTAHCFDPNEEYKLRQIIHDITSSDKRRLEDCINFMKRKLAPQCLASQREGSVGAPQISVAVGGGPVLLPKQLASAAGRLSSNVLGDESMPLLTKKGVI